MRKIIAFILFATTVFFACKTNPKTEKFASKYLNATNLQEQSFTINTKIDTAVTTQQGIIVKIAAGSIESATPNVTLQIKEALELEDILQAGLTTQTKDGILSSDGMFHIQTKEDSKIIKPLQIELPTEVVDDKMQLYKGVEEDGKIVWKEPKKIETPEPIGKTLFMKNCASCHAVDKKLTGPALANVEERWKKKDNLIAYIKHNQNFMKGDFSAKNHRDTIDCVNRENYLDLVYSRRLFCDYNKSAMTNFIGILTDKDVNEILKYIKKESKLLTTSSANTAPAIENTLDSCNIYPTYYEALLNKIDSFQSMDNSMVKSVNTQPTSRTVTTPPKSNASNSNPFGGVSQNNVTNTTNTISNKPISPKVTSQYYESDKYQFTIETFGWYNIDRLMNSEFSSIKSELTVTIQNTTTQKFQLYIMIPEFKVLSEGGLLKDGVNYGFYGEDASIYLPQGINAYVFAIGEENGKTFYGSQQFITSSKQHIKLKIQESTKDEILKKVKDFKASDFSMDIIKTNKFENIKAIEIELDRIQNKMWKCDCYNQKPAIQEEAGYENSVIYSVNKPKATFPLK